MGVRPGTPKPPGSGRKRGSIDREQRKLLTDKMAADIMKVYKRLGPDWLFEVAKERPDLFLNQCLSRMFPAPIKEDPDVQINTQFNMGNDPPEACHVEAPDPEREQWAREVVQTPEERLASESLDEHTNRRAFADRPPRPAWMPAEERTPVRLRS